MNNAKQPEASAGEIAVVTGAGSGIGRAVALALSECPVTVVAVGRKRAALDETAALARGRILATPGDIAIPAGRDDVVRRCRSLGRVRFLVHGAGIHPIEALSAITVESWREVMTTNVESRLFLSRDLLPCFAPGGRVLFVGSNSATRARIGSTGYCVGQAASFMLQECLKAECAPHHVLVTSAIPSPAHTPMIDAQIAADRALYPDAAEYRRLRDAGRLVAPAAVGKFFRWLLTEVDAPEFVAREWNIQDPGHQARWLGGASLYASIPR